MGHSDGNNNSNPDSSSASFPGRIANATDNTSDIQVDKPPSRFSFNSSFSTSGSVSAATKSSLTQSNHLNPQAQTVAKMMGPFDLEQWWPGQSSSALAFSSHYSPLNLHHLPQPIPSDAPSSTDASIFTFEDAFEDLLAVSQGQPLPDIAARYEQRKLLRSMFPEGEPAFFWLRRLQSQGLISIPEPSQFLRQAESNWDQFHRELDRRAANVWRAIAGEDDRNSRDVYEDADNFPESFHDKSNQRRDPDHFDDFFSSIRSSFPEPQSSWDTFVKSFNEDRFAKPPQEKIDKNHEEVTKDEYVDRFGYLHSKVTVKTLDEDGNQIGSQTHYTVRPAGKEDAKQVESNDNDNDKSGFHASGKVETKTGWFWK